MAIAGLAIGGALGGAAAVAGSVLVAVAASVGAWLLTRQLARLRRRIAKLGDQQAGGAEPGGWELTGALNDALRRQARDWTADRAELDHGVAFMTRLLDSLQQPLLTVTRDRHIALANRAARMLLTGAPDTDLTDKALTGLLRPPDVIDAVFAVLDGAEAQAVEFVMSGTVERHFAAQVTPIAPIRGGALQALLVLHDVTAARQTERMRVDFLANVSHELRTPLSTLIGFIETLRGPARDDGAARERFLTLMDAQTARMARLVEDLLSLSQIELGEHMAPTETVEIGSILSQVAEIMSLPAGERDIRLDLDLADDLPKMRGDSDQLTQLFQNLIDNAIKYGRPDSAIRIQASPAPLAGEPAIAVSVADLGDGIPAHHIPRLTERFYRVDTGRSRARGGTGLGLAIVKHVVNRHRGHLRIRSTLGEGSVFTVLLPTGG